ncbi:MAG: class I SAM-dependent methyltransferase [Myxococcaceae bacterium]|nr:class I SAM-dependent methyltransferase [Myxococcaceae bacterium]
MRARTRPGRLAAFDAWLSLTEQSLLSAPGTLVDVGFGVSAVTTFELAAAFPGHHVIGLEADLARLEAARREFVSLDLRAGLDAVRGLADVRVVRIANVGRALTKDDVHGLVLQAEALVAPGGVVLEGTTDVEGHVSAFHLWRRGAQPPLLVLHTDGARGFSPWLFRDVLPRALRRDVRPETPIHGLLTAWEQAWSVDRPADPLAAFEASARALAGARKDVCVTHVEAGFVTWQASA